jgi:hypothetical protein
MGHGGRSGWLDALNRRARPRPHADRARRAGHSGGGAGIWSPPARSQTARRAPTSAAGCEDAILDGSAKDASANIVPPPGQRLFSSSELVARHQGAQAQAASLISTASSRRADRLHFDPVEFAEHLRIALIDDARRLGIDV